MINLLQPKQNNIDAVLKHLLNALNVKISKSSREQGLQDHPSYPSLLAISDILTDWEIENQAYKIEKNEYNPDDLFFPFIAHGNGNGGQFMLVNRIVNGSVNYSDHKGTNQSITEKDFLDFWSGIALHASTTEKSGDKNYKDNSVRDFFDKIRIPLLIAVGFTCLLFVLISTSSNIGYTLLILTKIIGVSVSILLLIHSINANNPLIQNLCSLGNKNDCNAILKSDAAKVNSWLSWSEVGFFYFAGSTLSLLINPATLPFIAIINILALPYTIYSVSYQAKNKNWCILCCTVQVLLVLEFAINLILNNSFKTIDQTTFSIPLFSSITIAFLVPVAIWSSLKPSLLKAAQLQPLKQQLKKFKYNSDLFQQALTNQPKFAVPDDLMPITLGNQAAETTITMVSNPFCGPCAKAHETLDQWLSKRDDLKVKIIFSTADHDDDEKTKVSRHATALSLLNDTKLLETALNDWYKQGSKKYATWAEKYPVTFNGEMKTVTEKQKEWCQLADITVTPTILINGYKLPSPYLLEDIKFLLT
ncbi:thioredoxin domain-containing protein [Pedobacter namyangjuensis]|uniref:thioredoxin domain-containing protein n=1 Tax=Pedobacter namyangjuensis TaxID=600626 RepID=UPI000DE45147|nr:thioredoxin domain-containing protein [Pedobacter namyangjuensis]